MMKFTVNGAIVEADENKYENLLRFLREELGLYSVKNGCETGHCGTCTVIINGKAKKSCVTKIAKLEGADIETLENISDGNKLHPIQESFLDSRAVQCGFCTPGTIMSAKALLDSNEKPSREEVRKALKGNLCRCTGYADTVNTVQRAGAMMRGEDVEILMSEAGAVGDTPVRKDALNKVLGAPIYADDKYMADMLFGKLIYSEHAHAKINTINLAAAEAVDGVVKVAIAKDIPAQKVMGIIVEHQQIIAEDEVICVSDPVAVVYAETRQAAEEAAKLVKVDYDVLPGIFNPQQALTGEQTFYHGKNMMSHTKVRRGDVVKGFEEADVILEADFKVPFVEHAYLEPEACLSFYDDNGVMTLYSGSQGSTLHRDMTCKMLGYPEDKVRVIGTQAGGGFGGKEEPTVQLHTALGTYLTKRPVKITMTRKESLQASTKRHAEWLSYKIGAKNDGTIVALKADTLVDTGAYASLGMPVTFRSGVCAAGPYSVENAYVDSRSFYSNNPPAGAFRGFGSTQACFASEIMMDMVGHELGMDPFEIRLLNALEPGKQTITGQILGEGEAFKETLEAVREMLAKEDFKPSGENKKIGIGLAGSYKNVGLGTGIPDKAGAVLELKDGKICLYHGSSEIGQGTSTTMVQIASQATGIPYACIDVIENDTVLCPNGEETTGSRQTFISGNAVRIASEKFMELLHKTVIAEFNVDFNAISTEGVQLEASGSMVAWAKISELAEQRTISLRAEHEYIAPDTVPLPEKNTAEPGDDPEDFKIHASYCFATQAVIVEVDEVTGEYEVLKVLASSDLGRAINPIMAKGQIEGAVLMGMGYGSTEQFVVEEGQLVTDSLAKCGIIKIDKAPAIETILVEQAVPDGPFGAKGMGELPINPTAPALANAVFNAVGVRVNELPITKERVREGLIQKREVLL
jgi:CO/xanthine dehydrogenase Mo-binding subunit/aerobic-type carbon monoxide dehydrogenase small subunit (CoxS/CutS family)